MKIALFILFCFIYPVLVSAQSFHTVISIGTLSGDVPTFTPTKDNGFLITGMGFPAIDVPGYLYIIRLNPVGEVQWCKTITDGSYGMPSSVIQTADGGFLLSGSSILKLDSIGNIEWYRLDYSGTIRPTSDGGYISMGWREIDTNFRYAARILKLDADRNMQWQIGFRDTSQSELSAIGNAVVEVKDGFIVEGGHTDAQKNFLFASSFIAKVSTEGRLLWHRTIFDSSRGLLNGMRMLISKNNEIIIGTSVQNMTQSPALIYLCFDTSGNLKRTLAFEDLEGKIIAGIAESPNGDIHIAGTQFRDSSSGITIATISPSGMLKSVKRMHIPKMALTLTDMKSLDDGRLLLCGSLDVHGSVGTFMFVADSNTCFLKDILIVHRDVSISTDSNYILDNLPVDSPFYYSYTITDTQVTQYDLCSISSEVLSTTDIQQPAIPFPNPIFSNQEVAVALPEGTPTGNYLISVRNIVGREVFQNQIHLSGTSKSITIATVDLPVGTYTIELLDANTFASVWRGKVVKVH